MANINIYGELYNDTPGGYSVPASQVKDVTKGKTQDVINAEVDEAIAGLVPVSQKGAASGVATLDESGLVPASQLPSYVDDVIEVLIFASTAPATCAKGDIYYNTTSKKLFTATAANTWSTTGEDPMKGKIYVLLTASDGYDAESQFRWSGTTMVKLSDVGSGKVDKVPSAVVNNFAMFVSGGGIADSGKNANSFANANHQHNWNGADIVNKPTKLSQFTDDLGQSPAHTHSQYLTSASISGKADKAESDALSADVECETTGSTGTKTVDLDDYTHITGGCIRIKFHYKNTYNPADHESAPVMLCIHGENNGEGYPLYFDKNAVTNLNTWESGETVDVYFDGTKYMANSFEGLGTKIAGLEATLSSTSMGFTSGSNGNTVRLIKTNGQTDGIGIYGACSPAAAYMTMYKTKNNESYPTEPFDVGSGKSNPVTSTNSGTNFHNVHTFQNGQYGVVDSIRLRYKITFSIGVVDKGYREITITYVYPIRYGSVETSAVFDPNNLAVLTSGGSPMATTTASRSYAIYIGNTPRKIYFLVPKDNVTGVSSVRLLSDGNYSNVAGGIDNTLLAGTEFEHTHNLWVSTNAFGGASITPGNRTFIVNG